MRCPGCGADLPQLDGPVHPYITSSPACWAAHGQLFAEGPRARIAVDAYAAQHPGDGTDRRDRQSVFVHLMVLCAVLERGLPVDRADGLLKRAVTARTDFPVLERDGPGDVNVAHVLAGEHDAQAWAQAVWSSYAPAHALVRAELDKSR